MTTKLDIYLDHNSTTFVSKEVTEVVANLSNFPANPSSIHRYGRRAKGFVEEARNIIYKTLNVEI